MKKSKIVIIFIIFIFAILFCVNHVFGFSKGDKVKCTKLSYHYEATVTSDPQTQAVFYTFKRIKGSNNAFDKGTVLTYIENEEKDGICQVEYKEKKYYIKQANLTSYSTGKIEVNNDTAKKVYDEYKNVNVKNLKDEELKKASDKCILAKSQTSDKQLQIKLESIIQKLAKEANERGKETQEDGSFDGDVNTQDWQNEVDKAEEEQQQKDNEGGLTTITEDSIYQNPQLIPTEESTQRGLDDMIGDGDDFLAAGSTNYNQTALQTFSQTIYNILLTIGVIMAVLVGGFIGLKLMTITSAEEKAETTKLIIPYIVGCVVIFGGFAIWKIAVNILSNM